MPNSSRETKMGEETHKIEIELDQDLADELKNVLLHAASNYGIMIQSRQKSKNKLTPQQVGELRQRAQVLRTVADRIEEIEIARGWIDGGGDE
ncbi:hypothetical protein [Methylocystis parvus]|uniref:hypothetical protein n=1 Tax=Methylocystis parvus TaxID=134 RepID=UPI003C73FDC6